MGAGGHVGRVGGLAVALGIGLGLGLGLGAGVAAADDSVAPSSEAPAAAVADRPSATRVGDRPARRDPGLSRTTTPTAANAAVADRRASTRVPAPRAAAQLAGAVRERISADPTITWTEGVLAGNLGATSSAGLPLSYVAISQPSLGGKLGSGPLLPLTNFGKDGSFTYVPYASTLTDPTQSETFRIMALENSPFDQFVEGLFGELGTLLLPQVLAVIHRIPVVGALLSPIIGAARIVTVTVNPYTEAAGRPTAFTYMMPSFDDVRISVNYFPAIDVATGEVSSAPTVLAASGLACAANTDPNTDFGQLFPAQQFGSLTPGIRPLRTDSWTSTDGGPSYDGGGGYNVVTWDPRGEFASEGQLEVDNPFFEGRDVSAIISWLTAAANPARLQVQTDPTGDPLVGMTGGSYGGGIQLTTVDPRIDAIVPEIAWNSLLSSLYPNANQFKTGFGTILAAALAVTGARVNPAIYEGIITGAITGRLTPSQQAVLGSVGPTTLLNQMQAPTLWIQGIHDVLFPLQESVAGARTILANPYGTPVKLVWFCGGHGTCLDPGTAFNPYQDDRGMVDNLKWLGQYVAGDPDNPADTIPVFQWYDQRGGYHVADLLPFQDGFNQPEPYTAAGPGGLLGLVPLLGGSGPYPLNDLPFSIVNAGPALNALSFTATPPVGSQIVGAPTLSFDYTGIGTSRTVYAQLIDNTTRLVLGNIVTPIPVVLDGTARSVRIPLEDIVYTVAEGDSLTLQLTSSAVNYESFTTLGIIGISDVSLDLPLRAMGPTA